MDVSVGVLSTASEVEVHNHPLGHRWTLWFDNPSSRQKVENFGETLRAIYTFDTVEDFWRIQHNVALPGTLKPNCDIHLFKEGVPWSLNRLCTLQVLGVVPKWEDPCCEKGGRWTVTIPKSNNEQLTNEIWLNALLSCIGEMYEDIDEICGVACNIRSRGNRVCLWTSDSSNKDLQITIGRQFKHLVGVEAEEKISYLAHSDAKKMTNSNKARDLFEI